MQGTWVRSLVRELRYCMLHGAAKKKKKKSTVLLVTKSRMTLCNPMVAARQASLSFIVSQSLLKLMSGKEGGQEEKRAVEDEVVR